MWLHNPTQSIYTTETGALCLPFAGCASYIGYFSVPSSDRVCIRIRIDISHKKWLMLEIFSDSCGCSNIDKLVTLFLEYRAGTDWCRLQSFPSTRFLLKCLSQRTYCRAPDWHTQLIGSGVSTILTFRLTPRVLAPPVMHATNRD